MEEETIEASPKQKKPYVRPQLHELDGSRADGKRFPGASESFSEAPS
jgi:hypothetical protein